MAASTGTYEEIPVEQIKVIDSFNARRDVGDIEGLTESIKAQGVQVPLGVHKKKKDNYSLVYGFRRFAAAQEAGLESVPVRIYPTKTRKRDLYLLNLQENVVRENLNPMEEAEGAKRLADEKLGEEEITAALGWSKTLYTQRMSMLEYSEDLQGAVREDRVSVQQARAIARLPEEKQEKYIDVAQSLTTSKLRDMVDKELAKIEAKNNPEPADGDEGDGDEGTSEGDDGGAIDPALYAQSVITNVMDMVAFAGAQVEDDEERDTFISKAFLATKTVDFTALAADDLETLDSLLERIVDKMGCEGLADEYTSDGDDGDE